MSRSNERLFYSLKLIKFDFLILMMRKEKIQIIFSLIVMGLTVKAASLEISNTWHYFTNGVIFGGCLLMVFIRVRQLMKK